MSSAPAREPIVTRTYRPAPDQCVRALELLLKKPASKEGGPPTAHEDDVRESDGYVATKILQDSPQPSTEEFTSPERNGTTLRDYIAQFTELEPLGSIQGTGGWYHAKCILPGCEDPAQSLYVFSDGNQDSFMCGECGRDGELDEFRAYREGADVVSLYSHHTGSEFGENKSNLPMKTVGEVMEEAGEGADWLQEDLVARGAVTDVAGAAKHGGKTTFWCHAIVAGAKGEDHAGFATKPAKCLYLTEQGNNFAEALRESGLEEYPDYIRIVQFKDVTTVGWEQLIKQAGEDAHLLGFDAVIVDTFAAFSGLKGSEENDSGAVAEKMRVLRFIAQTYDLGVVLVRHFGKDGKPRGSSAFEAEADICVTISRPEGRHDPSVRHIAGVGRYGQWERNIQLYEGRYISLGTDDRVEFNRAVRFVKAILPNSPEAGMRKQEMLDKRTGEDEISASTLDRALSWLVKQGDVGEKQLIDKQGKPKVYWLAYKPAGDSGENENIYSHQTPTPSKEFGENKSPTPNADQFEERYGDL